MIHIGSEEAGPKIPAILSTCIALYRMASQPPQSTYLLRKHASLFAAIATLGKLMITLRHFSLT